jgi:haloalkane dehalogenase
MGDVFRTPDERFDGLPGLEWEPEYREWDGLRLAHLDEGGGGGGETVVMLHGEPTWSYLLRKVMPPLLEAGHRCIAPDLPGFGRSDKPLDAGWYSFDRHAAAVGSLLERLDLTDVTLLMHDWGGPIGLRVATTPGLRERVTRLAAVDAPLLTGEQDPGESWRIFRDLVAARDELPIGRVVRMGCRERLPREVLAAYDAPFPDGASQAGVRAFPRMVPVAPAGPVARAGREIVAALRGDERPALLMWAESDPIFPREQFAGALAAALPRGGDVVLLEGAGHFVPEDRGEELAELLASWLSEVARPQRRPAR